jgi:hypothetical protein
LIFKIFYIDALNTLGEKKGREAEEEMLKPPKEGLGYYSDP